MLRRLLLVAALALVWLMASDRGPDPARAADKDAMAEKAAFVHAVIIRLNKDAPTGEVGAILKDSRDLLAQIPSVREVRAGTPSDKGTPKLARSDYDVGLLVLFDDADGLKAYLEHPMHQEFVKRHNKNLDMDKLLVYDFMDQKK
jgi:hypothetical protein